MSWPGTGCGGIWKPSAPSCASCPDGRPPAAIFPAGFPAGPALLRPPAQVLTSENISAREVEEALAGTPGVREITVCAASDQSWGEIVCAVVVPDALTPTLEGLRERGTSAGLARQKLPARLVIVDMLPRTAAGKVRKADLQQLFAQQGAG